MNSYMFYDSVETVAKYGMLHPPSPRHTHTPYTHLAFFVCHKFLSASGDSCCGNKDIYLPLTHQTVFTFCLDDIYPINIY